MRGGSSSYNRMLYHKLEKMIEFKNNHFAVIHSIQLSTSSWDIMMNGRSLMRNRICIKSQKYISTDFLLKSRGKMVTLQWRKLTQSTSTVVKVYTTSNGTAWHQGSPHQMHVKDTAFLTHHTCCQWLTSTKTWGNNKLQMICILFKRQCRKRQWKPEKLSRIKETKETW